MKGFLHFLRTQGIAGLAIGFIIAFVVYLIFHSLKLDRLDEKKA